MPTATRSAARRVALVIGSEVPAGDFAFRVHSTFGSAVNLAVAGRRGLVTLVGEHGDNYPHGIRLATRERFDGWPLAAGAPGRRKGDTIVFEGPDGGDLLTIDLASAAKHERRPLPQIDPRAELAREAWAVCAFHLDGLQAEKETDLRLAALCGMSAAPAGMGERLAGAARKLGAAVRAGDAAAADRAAARVLGLGTGLTPSGDDFLCGLFAALGCADGEAGTARRFVGDWGAALSERLDATNAVSATFLECAIAGCFPGRVLRLAAAFAGAHGGHAHAGHAHEDARAALDELCVLGHSSGMDTATGFLFGLWLRTGEETRRYAP